MILCCRGINAIANIQELKEWMRQTNTKILVLQETKHGLTSTSQDANGYNTYFSSTPEDHITIPIVSKGKSKGNRKQEAAGIGIILYKQTAPWLTNVAAISSRLIVATLRTTPPPIRHHKTTKKNKATGPYEIAMEHIKQLDDREPLLHLLNQWWTSATDPDTSHKQEYRQYL